MQSSKSSRELFARRIDQFRAWHFGHRIDFPDRYDLLRYAAEVSSTGILRKLEVSFQSILSQDDAFLDELVAARLDHGRRISGIPMVVEIISAPCWAAIRNGANIDKLSYAQVKHLDRFLQWLTENGITRPNRQSFLSYVANARSPARLISLRRAFGQLEGVESEAIIVELPQAIATKYRDTRPKKVKRRPASPRRLSLHPDELPGNMRAALAAMRRGEGREGRRPPAPDIVKGIETTLSQLCRSCQDQGREMEITQQSVRAYILQLEGRTSRAATLNVVGARLLRFIQYSGIGKDCEPSLKSYVYRQRTLSSRQVKMKELKVRNIGGPSRVLARAVDLLAKAQEERSITWRMTRLNHALALALTMLLPLRVQDTELRFGTNIIWSGQEYWIDTRSHKNGAPIYGSLPDFLTPFIDGVLLQGRGVSAIVSLRKKAEETCRHLFLKGDGLPPMRTFVSVVWRTHFNTGSHISRTLIHNALGKKGVSGVAEALALCAQRDPRTALHYQTRALADARRVQALEALVAEFTDADMAAYFPDLDAPGTGFWAAS